MARTITLDSEADRDQARDWIRRAPDESEITFKRPEERKKTSPQDRRFHAMIRDVARQLPEYGGIHMDEHSWKVVFLDALFKGQTRAVPALDRMGMVALQPRWRNLTIAEAQEGITIVQAFGDTNGVRFAADKGLEEMKRG